MRLLLIEDGRDMAAALKQVLTPLYTVVHTETGLDALKHFKQGSFDVIILDLNLPDMPGLQVCETLRSEGHNTPILVLTGDNSVLNKIRVLDAGADDYLTKPFSLGELKARLRVLVRRQQQLPLEVPSLTVAGLTLDKTKYQVEREGRIIKLRRKEFALLECLMRHTDMVVTRAALGNYAWQGSDAPWTNTIDVHIKYLRDKVDRPFERPLIRTVHGLGYKLVSLEPAETKLSLRPSSSGTV